MGTVLVPVLVLVLEVLAKPEKTFERERGDVDELAALSTASGDEHEHEHGHEHGDLMQRARGLHRESRSPI